MPSASDWIQQLQLLPHPEGGYYREVYRSPEEIPLAALSGRYAGSRCFSTSIYFLLESRNPSCFHCLKTDELWHFHTGSPLTVHLLIPGGDYRQIVLGSECAAGAQFQACLPAGTWFGATVNAPDAYALVGCTLAPGFEFADFELGQRADLLAQYPQHQGIIKALTRP